MSGPGVSAALERVAELVARGEGAAARRLLDQVTRAVPAASAACVLCARLRFALGDYDDALALLARVGAGGTGDGLERAFEYLCVLGRYHDARALLAGDLGEHPRALALHARAADLLLRRRCPADALVHLERALARSPRAPRLRMAAAEALRAMERWDDAAAALRDALALAREAEAPAAARRYVAAGAAMALDIGALALADECARAALAAEPDALGPREVLGRLALYRGEYDVALAHADALVRAAGATATGHVLRIGAHVGAGRIDAARAEIDAALALAPDDAEALAWRGELALARGEYAAALADVDAAVMRAPGLLVSARMLRLMATIAGGQHAGETLTAAAYGEVYDAVCQVVPEAAEAFASRSPDAIGGLLARALAAMRGNRTTAPTWVSAAGVLAPVRFRPGPRYASRALLDRAAAAPADELLAGLDDVARAYPESGLPRAHRGELLLWLGRYAEARVDLERTIAEHPFTRWAYIGLSAVELVAGDPRAALAVGALGVQRMNNTVGPAVYVHRGEAQRRLGNYPDALADLTRACETHPSRVAAWLNLALVYAATGDAAGVARAYEPLRERALPLLLEAARARGVPLAEDGPPPSAGLTAVLEEALEMMRGNRSSASPTYVAPDGTLRSLTGWRSSQRDMKNQRQRELDAVRAALRRPLA